VTFEHDFSPLFIYRKLHDKNISIVDNNKFMNPKSIDAVMEHDYDISNSRKEKKKKKKT